jgi:signal transduction histidine kinase
MMKETDGQCRAVAHIVHDVNNKLAAIIGTVDVLMTQVDSGSELSMGLKDILAAALEVRELARQIPRVRPLP